MLFKTLFLLTVFTGTAISSWYSSPQKGWLWYKKTPLLEQKHHPQKEKGDNPAKKKSYREKLKEFRTSLEEIKSKAVLEPTLENVLAFKKAHNELFRQATFFSEKWMLASLLSSDGYKEADQPYPIYRKISEERKLEKLERDIKQLSKSFGIFFLFKKECPYCHEFIPIVREFVQKYGFDCKAISPTGEPIRGFDSSKDNGTLHLLNPQGIYPSLFLVNPKTREVIPLCWGLVSADQLKENFSVIIQSLRIKTHDS